MQEFYFKGSELGTQMFLQLAELAEQLLDQIRVLNAGRGLGEHLVQPTHSTDEETEATGPLGGTPNKWHSGSVLMTSLCAFHYSMIRLKIKICYADFNLGTPVDSCQ